MDKNNYRVNYKIDDKKVTSKLFDLFYSADDNNQNFFRFFRINDEGNNQNYNSQDLPTECHPDELVANNGVQYDLSSPITQSNGTDDDVQSNNNHNIIHDFDDSNEQQSLDLGSPNNNLLDPKNNPKELLSDNLFTNRIDQILRCGSYENERNDADFWSNNILSKNPNEINKYDNINKGKTIFNINNISESIDRKDIQNISKLLNKKRKRKNNDKQLKNSHDYILDFNSSNKKQSFSLESPKFNTNTKNTINHSFLDDDFNNQNLNTFREEENERNDVESGGNNTLSESHKEINKKENINKKNPNNIVIIPFNKKYYNAHEKDYIKKNKTIDFETMSISEISKKYKKFSILNNIFKKDDLTYIENHGIIYKLIVTKYLRKNKKENKEDKEDKEDQEDKVKLPSKKLLPIRIFGKLKTFINKSNIKAINNYEGLDDKIKTPNFKEEILASQTKDFNLAYSEQPLYNILSNNEKKNEKKIEKKK